MWLFIMFFITVKVGSSEIKVQEGDVLNLHPRFEDFNKDHQILWTFSNDNQSSRIAQLYHGNIYTHYENRFSGRVQLNERTGDLNISNISTDDSGLYEALIVLNKQITKIKFKVDAFARVSVPVIIISSSLVSVHQSPAFLSLCLQVLLYCNIKELCSL
ncbi:SLAM family member 9-like [Triplophysa dalaica]|uniref:SLAM family member 9-like n=1 Tax=Triplophysa dalaica TaxID=1582913 RepID=UPI0024E01F98|nr:SLAM family member 9-like [Triplophysa dalaica]